MIEAVGKLLKIDDVKSDSYFSTFQIFKAISNQKVYLTTRKFILPQESLSRHKKVYLTTLLSNIQEVFLVQVGNQDVRNFSPQFDFLGFDKGIFYVLP